MVLSLESPPENKACSKEPPSRAFFVEDIRDMKADAIRSSPKKEANVRGS